MPAIIKFNHFVADVIISVTWTYKLTFSNVVLRWWFWWAGTILLSVNPATVRAIVCPNVCMDYAGYMTCPSSGIKQLNPPCNCCYAPKGCTIYHASRTPICTAIGAWIVEGIGGHDLMLNTFCWKSCLVCNIKLSVSCYRDAKIIVLSYYLFVFVLLIWTNPLAVCI